MDITTFLPHTNKAGLSLIAMLTKDNEQKEFKKVVKIVHGYSIATQHLLNCQVSVKYIYDLVYTDYKNNIKERINQKYQTYVMNILHTKYKFFMNKIIGSEQINYNNIDNIDNFDNEPV